MLRRRLMHGAAVVWLGFCLAGLSTAQERKGDSSGGYSAIIDNIDMLVDNYAKFLGRKYDLNDEQFDFTKIMIREKVYGFLDHHENEVRDLFDQMFRARTQKDMSQEDLILWGKRVAPIYEEAKKIIEAGNHEWREILDDKQRAIHDQDLQMMADSFKETDEKVERIQQGELSIEEFVKPSGGGPRRPRRPTPQVANPAAINPTGEPIKPTFVKPVVPKTPEEIRKEEEFGTNPDGNPPPVTPLPTNPPDAPPPGVPGGHDPHAGQPDQPGAQPGGEVVPPPQPMPTDGRADSRRNPRIVQPKAQPKNFESEWERYVREFIQKYELNDEQTQKANVFLADCEAQADRILASKKSELERITDRETELRKPVVLAAGKAPGDAKAANDSRTKELADLGKRRDELLSPINRIFEDQLKPKLERLPTRAQRKSAEEKAAKAPAAKAAIKAAEKKDGKKP